MTWKCTNTAKGDNKLYSDAKGVVPSLDLRFAEGKNLNDYMTGQNLITFSRPVGTNQSPGTYVDENGIIQLSSANQPRFDHDPTTGESLGLLVEESRTNEIETSSDVSWYTAGFNLTYSFDQTTSPDNTLTADLVTENTANDRHDFIRSGGLSLSTSTTYTYSIFLKPNGRTFVKLRFDTGASFAGVNFNLTGAGSIGTVDAGRTGTIQQFPNGWYRCSVTYTVPVSQQYPSVRLCESDNVDIYQGDGVSGVYAWGSQLEIGSFPTSYIPTSGTALTRSADVASITGSNFSSWYNPAASTLHAEVDAYDRPAGTINYRVFGVNDGTNNNRQEILLDTTNNLNAFGRTGGVNQFNLNLTQSGKSALASTTNDAAFTVNGLGVVTDNTVTIPLVDRAKIGCWYNDTGQLNGTIARLTYFPYRIPDATLQAITAS